MNAKWYYLCIFAAFLVGCSKLSSDRASNSDRPNKIATLDATSLSLVRKPSISELNSALAPFLSRYLESPYVNEFSSRAQLDQLDLNGDQKLDLIILEQLLLVILLWDGQNYSQPFVFTAIPPKYGSLSQLSYADWTGDESPEVAFEILGHTGGSGLSDRYQETILIHCEIICTEVWNSIDFRFKKENILPSWVGMTYEEQILRGYDDASTSYLEVQSQGFAVDGFSFSLAPELRLLPELTGLAILTKTLTTYEWRHGTFQLIGEQIVQPFSIHNEVGELSAGNGSGILAEVKIATNFVMNHQRCQTFIQSHMIGPAFVCNPRLTRLSWQDITNDSHAELLVETIASPGYNDVLELEAQAMPDCHFEHLQIFKQSDEGFLQIANLRGCIISSEFFGINIIDSNDDGVVELEVGREIFNPLCYLNQRCWFEPSFNTSLYTWNGTEFDEAR